jgi:potassium uptake protein ktrB
MFIGFSPASTAGGIRNITVSILFLSAISMILGRKSVSAFKRQIGKQTLIKAINIFTIGIIIVILGTLLGTSAADLNEGFDDSQKQFNMLHILFEICSAFGSSGLSTGITPNMNA